MKYYINHNTDGKILGFVNQSTGINTEVTNTQYAEAQKFNKIIITDGVITFDKVDWRSPAEIQEQSVAHYKSLYLGVVNAKLKELDYDSLATVKLWESDATFGTEATRILTWYKAIILKNYQLLTAGVPMTDEEYLASINAIVF